MHWADVEANKLAELDVEEHVIATGITPSGPIHVGNMREILTADSVFRALRDLDVKCKLIYIGDTIDPLRKVYPFLDDSYEQYIGQPLSDIPCPCGDHESYASHFLEPFLNALEILGVDYQPVFTHKLYEEGQYSDSVKAVLENVNDIRSILESISQRDLDDDWYPYRPKCSQCNRLTTTVAKGFEYPYVNYTCQCGNEDKVDIRTDNGKLPWRVDWPARWNFLGVTCEPYGKDHAAAGGSYDTGKAIIEKVFNRQAPHGVVYEWIQLKGQGVMSSSTGVGITAVEMLKMTPPEVLRFLMVRVNPNKHIDFDPGVGLLNIVDEYDSYEKQYFEPVEGDEPEDIADRKRTWELSQTSILELNELRMQLAKPDFDRGTLQPVQIPYRHLVTLIQINESWDWILDALKRTDIITDLTPSTEKHLRQRLDCVRFWLDNFAPDPVKFAVMDEVPADIMVKLDDKQKKMLKIVAERFSELDKWQGEEIHNIVHTTAKELEVSAKAAFKAFYLILIGKDRGPRLGYFLSTLDKEFVLNRLQEASAE
jgi:lysyl-tRNA synthetase class 1